NTPPSTTIATTTPSNHEKRKSRLHLNKHFRGEGCEVFYRVHSPESLVPEEHSVIAPVTYESGHCSHHCKTDRDSGKWVCCLPTEKEPVVSHIVVSHDWRVRIRTVENATTVSCGYL
ncbi:hypothetical protein PFISCL1PPCAC_7412, partial [Pristionchus fissidentatus]